MDYINSLSEGFLRTRKYLLPLILAFAAIIVYANSFRNGFVWDDSQIIVTNHENRELGNIYYLSGLFTKAREYYFRSVQSNPENAEAHYNLARTLEKLNDTDGAFLHYRIFLQKASPEYAPQSQQVKDKLSGNLSRDKGHSTEK